MFRAILLAACLAVPSLLAAQDTGRLVKLVTVEESDNAVTRQFFGHVVAKQTVDLAFQVGGQVVDLPVIEGQPIAKGALVAQLDMEPFELALDQARVQKDQADRTQTRLKRLEGSAASRVSVEDAETNAMLANISVRNAERSLNHATLNAPFDALVASRNVANFTTISPGIPIVRLHDMSDLRIEIDVPEILFQRAGQQADMEIWAKFPSSDTRYPLQVREFNAETSQVGQTFRITLGMAPPDDLLVLPGSSVTVYTTLRLGASFVAIPGAAVVTDNDGSTKVMLFNSADGDSGTVQPVDVTITPGSDGAMHVTAGLEPGQEIVASGASRLKDGDKVRRFTGFSN